MWSPLRDSLVYAKGIRELILVLAISEGHGDTALVLLRAGVETDKRDVDGNLAINLAPDKKVCRRFRLLRSSPLT